MMLLHRMLSCPPESTTVQKLYVCTEILNVATTVHILSQLCLYIYTYLMYISVHTQQHTCMIIIL